MGGVWLLNIGIFACAREAQQRFFAYCARLVGAGRFAQPDVARTRRLDMHVLMVMAGGLLLLLVFILFGWLWGGDSLGMALATKAFVPFWLLMAGINMWVGVTYAGYSVRQELPILLLVFAMPTLAAGIALWQFARA
ncbi:hypothetical protein C4K27_3819 [Pseudomonas chlororaphis subsp. chlororaphis]|nr:hypothetical protein C4K27_3819 [Pseudomonas chlororaphis subsp. chlororaphis]